MLPKCRRAVGSSTAPAEKWVVSSSWQLAAIVTFLLAPQTNQFLKDLTDVLTGHHPTSANQPHPSLKRHPRWPGKGNKEDLAYRNNNYLTFIVETNPQYLPHTSFSAWWLWRMTSLSLSSLLSHTST